MKKLAVIGVSLALGIAIPSPSYAAAKAGAKCTKVNQTSGSGAAKLTCKKVNKKLVWVKTPAANPMGTASNPVPMGTDLTVGDFSYRLDGIEFGLDAEICASNSFNDGCTYDDDYKAIVDPAATFNWAAVTTFSLVLPSGQLLGSEIFALGENDFSQLQVIPGGSGSGRIFFQIPKAITTLKSLLVIRDSSSFTSTKDVYFKLEW